jgi:hypothetical protein
VVRPARGILSWGVVVALGLSSAPGPAAAQERPDADTGGVAAPEPPAPAPTWTFSAGIGQTYGGLGAAAEYYLADGRVSLGLGAGRIPDGAGFGVTGRAFFGPPRTRGWIEGSISLLGQETEGGLFGPVTDRRDFIGPGVSGGLRLMPASGLTLTLGGGAGYARGRTLPMIHLGAGWTTLKSPQRTSASGRTGPVGVGAWACSL